MSLVRAELLWYKSATVNDTTSNGGVLSSNAIANAIKSNIFGNVSQAVRTAGGVQWRKVFLKVANDDDLSLLDAKIYIENYTNGEDNVCIFPGSQTDTQATVTGSEQLYGTGQLNENASATDTEIDVLIEAAALDLFKDGMTIRISDKEDIDGSGNVQFVTLNGDATYDGDVATLTLDDPLDYDFAAADTRVASCIVVSEIVAAYTSFTVTAAGSGDYDDSTYPILVDHIGGVTQDWTLTFTSATAFNITGNTLGSVGSGTVSSAVQPTNPVFSKPYFFMNNLGFQNTFQAGDTITFSTTPAAYPIWMRRQVPAGAASLTGNSGVLAVTGDSG